MFKYEGKIKTFKTHKNWENELWEDLHLMLIEVLQVEEERYHMGI